MKNFKNALQNCVAVIKVGAATEVEMKEKKLRIEDALAATKAAVEEGIVAGGGVALVNAVADVEKVVASCEGDEKTGACIVLKSIEEPLKQIAVNAGFCRNYCALGLVEVGKIYIVITCRRHLYVGDFFCLYM